MQNPAEPASWSAVSIVVPTYNEAENLPVLIERLAALREGSGLTLELIIVDDDSRDGTQAVIDSLRQPWVKLIVRKGERGLSSAVIRGLREASHELLVVMDADLSHPPEKIPELIARLRDGADFVIGSRYVKGGSTDASWGLFRWLNSKVATLLARPFARAVDPMSGFFALRKRSFEQAHELNPIGYKIGLELLVKCGCQRVEEVPIHFADRTRGQSKLNLREQIRYLQHLSRLFEFRFGGILHFAALFIVLAAFLIPTIRFLPHEAIFVDETTQMNGLTLGPIEVTKWLAGHEGHRFGVPPDRMPPMSYWIGSAWSSMFGLSESSMRWLGLLCVTAALIVLFETARRAWGLAAAIAAGCLFALSPNTIVCAVAIRAYPIFLLFATCGFACLVGLISGPPPRQRTYLAGIVLFSLLAMYTHHFGLLMAGSLLTAAFVSRWLTRQSVLPVVLAAGVIGISAIGLYPFVKAANDLSVGTFVVEKPTLSALVKFIYRGLFGHPAISVSRIALATASLAFIVLVLLALFPKRQNSRASYAVLAALAAGAIVAVASNYVFTDFDAMHPSYNIWRLPGFALLLGSAAAIARVRARAIATAAIIALIAASGFGASQFVMRPASFTHGPHHEIADIIRSLGPANVVVIHAGGATWGQIYYPILYTFAGTVPQYLDVEDAGVPTMVRTWTDPREFLNAATLTNQYLLVIQSEEQNWSEMAAQIRGEKHALPPLRISAALAKSGRWQPSEQWLFVAFVAAEVSVFKRTADPPAPGK